MNKPYIGVTGIEEPTQLEEMLKTFSQIPSNYLLMIGGIVSYKTLIGEKNKPIFLTKNKMKDIFKKLKDMPTEDVLLAFHYFTKPLNEVRLELREKAKKIVEQPLSQQISELIKDVYEKYERDRPPFQLGVQINVSWPDSKDVNQIKVDYPKLRTILQVSNFDSVEDRIRNYNVDYVLVDASRGEGKEFDVSEALRVHDIITRKSVATIGFAGGLSPENVREKVLSLRKGLGTTRFCIDAQGRLRTGNYLDINKVEKYLRGALNGFQG